MGTFVYRARDREGKLVVGELEAQERLEANRKVVALKLIPIEVKPFTPGTTKMIADAVPRTDLFKFMRGISPEDLMFFFQQLQTVYTVGIPLMRGLRVIEEQCENPRLKHVVTVLADVVADGNSISDGLKKFPEHFDPITISLVQAGESSGQLEGMLDRIAKLMQQRLEQRAKMKSAMFYPKIVVGMIAVVFMVVVYFVIPKFTEFFSKFGAELPLPTRMMLGLSNFMTGYWYLIFGVVGLVIFAYRRYVSTPHGRRQADALYLRLPIFGMIFLQNDLLSFCGVFEMLIKSGIPMTDALPIVKGAIMNTGIRDDMDRARESVIAGKSLVSGLEESKTIPKSMTSLLGIGEEAGALEKTLNRLSHFYQMQLDYRLSNLSKMIEPILLIAVFAMVLFIALAVFLPMWKMNSIMRR